ncbi:hypothetical protein ANCCAN_20056 [Ancylostoma caninum]|uniref:Uncharacterized protein n=1 Tax=Ancylostoma caninum TaxID=29170 RepID=A0A368FPK9_ANCCA|nr:hypothetical protein ANCCAN_20056 [Ancylostoma caninum]
MIHLHVSSSEFGIYDGIFWLQDDESMLFHQCRTVKTCFCPTKEHCFTLLVPSEGRLPYRPAACKRRRIVRREGIDTSGVDISRAMSDKVRRGLLLDIRIMLRSIKESVIRSLPGLFLWRKPPCSVQRFRNLDIVGLETLNCSASGLRPLPSVPSRSDFWSPLV